MDVLETYYGPGHTNNEYERIWVKDVSGQRRRLGLLLYKSTWAPGYSWLVLEGPLAP